MNMPHGKKAVGAGIGIVIVLLLGYRLVWYRPPVQVIAVKQAEIHGRVHGPGTVQSKVPVTVSPKLTGILEKLHADQGDRVRKGQLLAELDAIELKARAAAAQAAGRITEKNAAGQHRCGAGVSYPPAGNTGCVGRECDVV